MTRFEEILQKEILPVISGYFLSAFAIMLFFFFSLSLLDFETCVTVNNP